MKYVFFILFFLFRIGDTFAQAEYSFSEIIQYYPEKTKKIADKIRQGFLSGNLKAYTNDSLASTYTKETAATIGSTVILNDDGTIKGYIPINSDSTKLSLSFSYKVVAGSLGSVAFKPVAIASTFETSFFGMSIRIPFAWAALNELQKVLSKDELNYVYSLAQWYQVFPKNKKSSDYENSAYIDLENWLNTGLTGYIDPVTGENYIGKVALNNAKFHLFEAVKLRKIYLMTDGFKNVNYNDFSSTHMYEMKVTIDQWNNWGDTNSIPGDLKDTMIQVLPMEFDSIGFQAVNKKMYWVIIQKLNSGESRKYYIDYQKSRNDLPIAVIEMMDYFIEDKIKKN